MLTGTLIRHWRSLLGRAVSGARPVWSNELARSLRTGRIGPAFDQHLDELLLWLSNPDHPRAAELTQAIRRQGLEPARARSAAFRLLDRYLFEGPDRQPAQILGLKPGADPGSAKQRYRRLIQVYHPDRHPDRPDWATRRSEQINRAFAALQRGETRRRNPRPADQRARRRPFHWLGAQEAYLRPWKGFYTQFIAPLSVRRRLGIGVTAVILFALLGLLWPKERPKPAPRVIHRPIGTEAPRSLDPQAKPPLPEGPAPPAQTPGERDVSPPPEPAKPPIAQRTAPADGARGAQGPRRQETPALATPTPPAPGPDTASTPAPQNPFPDSGLFDPKLLGLTKQPPPMIPGPEPPKAPLAPKIPLPEVGDTSAGLSQSEPPAPPCWTAAATLRRFKEAYQEGALDELMALYSPFAKENALEDWFAIRQAYDAWFRLTLLRQIDFDQVRIQPFPDSRRCAIRARYQVGYLDQQARLVSQIGELELLLEPKGADWLILEARY